MDAGSVTKVICFVDGEYFFISIQFGKGKPFNERLYDLDKNTEIKNKRGRDQVELRESLFGLIDLERSVLYISNLKKVKLVIEFLASYMGIPKKEITTRKECKTPEEIISICQILKSVQFEIHNDLFCSPRMKGIVDVVKDVTGLGCDPKDKILIQVKLATKSGLIPNIISRIFKSCSDGEIDSLVCSGQDENKLDVVLNMDTFVKKISVHVEENENGMYEPKAVFFALKKELEKRK